ncbi:MAG: hypothetical protein MHPSP_003188, partial [Paramarteilia canceri]
ILFCVNTLHANESFQKERIDNVEKRDPNALYSTNMIYDYDPTDLNNIDFNRNDNDDNDNISNNIWSKMSLISKIFLSLFGFFIGVIVVFFVTCCCFCGCFCGCCCGMCGKTPDYMSKYFRGKKNEEKNDPKHYIKRANEDMEKAQQFLNLPNQHSLAVSHLENANKNFEEANKLLQDLNKTFFGPGSADKINENNEKIAENQRKIEKNAQIIKCPQVYQNDL